MINTILIDFDGVITDGKKYYSAKGDSFLSVNSKDNAALSELVSRGFRVILITMNASKIISEYARRLKLELFVGRDKLQIFKEKINENPEYAIFIGDDVADIPLMKIVRHPMCPIDSHKSVYDICHSKGYILRKKGGDGLISLLLEEFIELKQIANFK